MVNKQAFKLKELRSPISLVDAAQNRYSNALLHQAFNYSLPNIRNRCAKKNDAHRVYKESQSKIVTFQRSDIIFNNLGSVMLKVSDMTDEKNLLMDAEKQKFRCQVNKTLSQNLLVYHDAISVAQDALIDRLRQYNWLKVLAIYLKSQILFTEVQARFLDDFNSLNLTEEVKYEMKVFEVQETFKTILNCLESTSQGKRLSLVLKQSVKTLKVRSDYQRFKSILYMLLFNAIKESRDESKIEVEIFTMPMQADNNPIGTTDQSRNLGKKLSEAKKSFNKLYLTSFEHLLVVKVQYYPTEDLPLTIKSIDQWSSHDSNSNTTSTRAIDDSNACLQMICKQICKFYRGSFEQGVGPDYERTYIASILASIVQDIQEAVIVENPP